MIDMPHGCGSLPQADSAVVWRDEMVTQHGEALCLQALFGQVGPQDFLMDEYGLRAANIVAAVKKAISRK